MSMASSSSNFQVITNDSHFQKDLIAAGSRLVVVDFFATWCGPCKQIAPKFVQLSKQYPTVLFWKVDVDICRSLLNFLLQSTAMRYEVNAMPTFLFFKNREKVHQVRGANEAALESAIIQHSGSDTDSTEAAVSTSKVSVPGQMSLLGMIDNSGSECLNESDLHPFQHALSASTDQYLESDCDEQLIIALAFQQPIKLHSLQLVGPTDGRAPKTVKLFSNQPQTLDFDAAEQRKPVQEFVLTEEDVGEESVISLHYVKYQNVQNITIFVKDNQGGEETTVINHIGLFGSPLDTTNMSEFKRVSGEKGEKHQ